MKKKEQLSQRYADMIKNNYKNVLGEIESQKRSIRSKKKLSDSLLHPTPNKRKDSLISLDSFNKLVLEMNNWKQKYENLQKKYMETHNDLLRSKTSLHVEVMREKRRSDRSLRNSMNRDSLRVINETKAEIHVGDSERTQKKNTSGLGSSRWKDVDQSEDSPERKLKKKFAIYR